MLGIAVVGENSNFMPTVLETNSSVNNKSFCPTNPQIGMKKDNMLGTTLFGHDVGYGMAFGF